MVKGMGGKTYEERLQMLNLWTLELKKEGTGRI